jgi:uncharacterized protein YaiI (UPF0178 family)
MPTIYIDADACPVKDETYRVAARYAVRVVVVANNPMGIPAGPLVEMVVQKGFGAADDWIAEQIGPGDIAITADIPLAARCVAAGCVVLDPKGRVLDDASIGEAVAIRDLMTDLREAGGRSGGPSAMTPKDRSRFLSELDRVVNAALRMKP